MPAPCLVSAPLPVMAPLKLVNQHTARTISAGVEVAVTRRARRKGLLGRDGMAPSEALYLAPCFAIHTAFMRFRIDVVFVDAIGRVLKIVRNMPPWRPPARLSSTW